MALVEPTVEESQPSRKFPIAVGWDELNLAEFPLTSLARRVPESCKSLVFEDKIRDQSNGSLVTRRLTVTGDEKYGLPNTRDEDVIVALIQITKISNNFTEPTVYFSRFDLIELLGWPDNGQSLRRLDESLNRWLGVTLRYEKAWWDKTAQSWVNEGFHMLDQLSLYDKETIRNLRRRENQTTPSFSSFTWNKVVFRSFQAENLKTLDLDLYFKLEHPTSKRAYRFLDKRFYRSGNLEFDLRNFACEHIGLSKDYDTGQLKEKLKAALEELENVGFLEPLPKEQRFTKKARHGGWCITLNRSGVLKSATKPSSAHLPQSPFQGQASCSALHGLSLELVNRGVTRETAETLVQEHDAEKVRIQIEVFDWLIEKKDKRVSKSPGGYLAESVRKEYVAPKGFEPKAAREAKQAAERQRVRTAAEVKRQAKETERARETAEAARIAAYLGSLDAGQRDALQAEALAAATSFFASKYRQAKGNPESEAYYLKLIVDMHVSEIVKVPD